MLLAVTSWFSSPTAKDKEGARRRRETDSDDEQTEHEEDSTVPKPPKSKRRKSEVPDGPGPSNQILSSTRRSFGHLATPYNFQGNNASMIPRPHMATNVDETESTDDEIGPLPSPVKRPGIHETEHNVLRMNNKNNNSSDRSISEPPVAPTQPQLATVSDESIAEPVTETRMSGFLGNRSKKFRASTGELSLQNTLTQNSLARQSFNPSLYGSSWSLNSGGARFHRTISPFYGGRTIYGGASAYSRRDQRFQQTLRVPTQIRPSSSLSSSSSNTSLQTPDAAPGISNTSKRIMELLGTFTSPLKDARKMGTGLNTAIKVPTLLQNTSRFNADDLNASRSVRLQQPKPYSRPVGPPINELQVPTISQLLHIKRLQSSTEQVRKIAVQSKSTLNDVREYQLPIHTTTTKTPTKPTITAEHKGKQQKPMKSIQKGSNDTEMGPTLKLPDAKLSLTSVPKIDLPTNAVASQQVKPATIVIIKNNKNANANNKFQFSAPVTNVNDSLTSTASDRHFKFSQPLGQKESVKPALESPPQLKQGSCLDALFGKPKQDDGGGNDLFKKLVAEQKSNKWECPACMILNDTGKTKCVSCGGAKPGAAPALASATPAPAQDNLFKQIVAKNSKKWECPTCMIQNADEKPKCVACETPNPAKVTPINPTKATPKGPPADALFQKLAANSAKKWECPLCMIQNAEEHAKCVACETARPGKSATPLNPTISDAGFKSLVAKQSANWECNICLVKNESNRRKCIACEASKLEPLPKDAVLSYKGFAGKYQFGVPDVAATSAPTSTNAVTFGVVTKPTTINFGSTTETTKPTPVFSFGKPSASTVVFGGEKKDEPDTAKAPDAPITTSSFVFTKPDAPKFSFGAPTTTTQTAEKKVDEVQEKKATGFSFGGTAAPVASTTSPAAFGGFSFGSSKLAVTTTTSAPSTQPPAAIPTFGSAATATLSTFGSATAVTTTTSPPSFGFSSSTPAKTVATTTVSSSVFGPPPRFDKFAGYNFPTVTTTAATAEQPTKTPLFGLGSGTATLAVATPPAPTPSFSFTGGAKPTPAPATTNAPFVFGTASFTNNNASLQPAAPFQQQATNSPQPPQTTIPVFGSAGNMFQQTPSPPTFGGFATPAAPPTFGSTGSGSVFGSGGSQSSSSEQVAKKANTGGFSFSTGGSASSAGSGTPSPFAFGDTNKPAFNFSPAVKPSFNFTSAAEPQQQQLQQGLGSNSNVPFQFGAAPSPAGVFAFGNPVEPQPPPTDPIFAFGAPNNNTAFPTTQTAGMAARRKIKATRRIQR